MTDRLDFETRLQERLRARAALASRPFDAAAIAREAVAVDTRGRRFGGLEWPSTRPALGWLVVAMLLAIALLGAVAGIGALLRERPLVPDPVPVGQMTVIRLQVDAINARDVDAFVDTFAAGAAFGPGGDFRESSSLLANSLPLADTSLVEAWTEINDAWDLEAELIACTPNHDPGRPRYADGDTSTVDCEVATRWRRLSLEVRERWSFEFAGAGLSHWGFGLMDLNPSDRVLPLGYDDLEAWEAWLAATDPRSAARYLNPRTMPDCDGCSEWQDSLAPGDPERAAELARLLLTAENDWSVQGHDFAPFGLIPYDPAFADEIEASIQEYLGSR